LVAFSQEEGQREEEEECGGDGRVGLLALAPRAWSGGGAWRQAFLGTVGLLDTNGIAIT
jgi:hypothetical protein